MEKPYTLNKIEGFNPYDFIEEATDSEGRPFIDEQGNVLKYLSTNAKVLWFRNVYPSGKIIAERKNTDNPSSCRFAVSVFKDVNDEHPLVTWEHQETLYDREGRFDMYCSKAETVALGKALSRAGFGCEIEAFLGISSEGDFSKVIDTPQIEDKTEEPKKKKEKSPNEEDALESASDEAEIKDLMAQIEVASNEEETQENKEPEVSELDKYLDSKFLVNETAGAPMSVHDGKTFRELILDNPNFCKIVLRPRVKTQVTSETLEAATYIAENYDKEVV